MFLNTLAEAGRITTVTIPNKLAVATLLSPVKTLIFAARGSSVPANLGFGYIFDNLTTSDGNISGAGSLAGEMQFATWVDNSTSNNGVPGDNIHQADEPITFGPASLGAGTTTLPLADSAHGPAFTASSTHYVGIAWCAGTMHVDGSSGAITCDGASMGNEAQDDSMTANVTLLAEQSRNNPTYTCPPSTQ